MSYAFHHAIDLIFTVGIVVLGWSLERNAETISRGILRSFSLGLGFVTGLSPQSVARLGKACFMGGMIAGLAYLVMIPFDLILVR